MRPARKGPENWSGAFERFGGWSGFNEAGPQGAGKRDRTAIEAAKVGELQ